jgi:hypothetical protein
MLIPVAISPNPKNIYRSNPVVKGHSLSEDRRPTNFAYCDSLALRTAILYLDSVRRWFPHWLMLGCFAKNQGEGGLRNASVPLNDIAITPQYLY